MESNTRAQGTSPAPQGVSSQASTSKTLVGVGKALLGLTIIVGTIALPLLRMTPFPPKRLIAAFSLMSTGGVTLGLGLNTLFKQKAAADRASAHKPPAPPTSLAPVAVPKEVEPNACNAALKGTFSGEAAFNVDKKKWDLHIQEAVADQEAERSIRGDSGDPNYQLLNFESNGNMRTMSCMIGPRQYDSTFPLNTHDESFSLASSGRTLTMQSADAVGSSRPSMEDAHVTQTLQLGGQSSVLSVLCDGHGDKGMVAQFVANNFNSHITNAYNHFRQENGWDDQHELQPHEVANILSRACVTMQDSVSEMLKAYESQLSPQERISWIGGGACLVGSLIIGDDLYTVNVGDSRAIAAYHNAQGEPVVQQLTYDAKPTAPPIKEQVEERGGQILKGSEVRLPLGGALGVARSFGDLDGHEAFQKNLRIST